MKKTIITLLLILTAASSAFAMKRMGDTFTLDGIRYVVSKGATTSGANDGECMVYELVSTMQSKEVIDIPARAYYSDLTGQETFAVIGFADYSLENNKNIKGVIINGAVKRIGFGAFKNCTSLQYISLAPEINKDNADTNITNDAFSGVNLNRVALFTTVDNETIFKNDPNRSWAKTFKNIFGTVLWYNNLRMFISDLKNPLDVEIIEDEKPFQRTGTLDLSTGIALLSGSDMRLNVVSISQGAFQTASWTEVKFPATLKEIKREAFYNSSLTSADFSRSECKIGESAFSNCNKLADIKGLENVKSLSSYAFYACHSLKSRLSFYKITQIGRSAFGYCENIPQVWITSSEGTVIDSYAFQKCSGLTNVYFVNCGISDNAFVGCSKLSSVTLTNMDGKIRDNAFKECTALSSLRISGKSLSLGNYVVSEDSPIKTVELNLPEMPEYTPSSLSFDMSAASLIVPLEHIFDYAENSVFGNFGAIESVDWEDENDGLYYKGRLNGGRLEGVMCGVGEKLDEKYTVTIADHIERCDLYFPVKAIDANAFWDHYWFTTVNIPDGITEIGDKAFEYVKIKNLNLPHTIKKIGYRAFGGMDNLNYVSCPVMDPALISTDLNAFDESKISALELHVPSGSKNKYSNCAPWSGFNSFSETSNTVYGDVNSDGKLNAADLSYMLQRISNLSNPGFYVGSADLTGDRKVDMDDVEKLRKEIIKNYKK